MSSRVTLCLALCAAATLAEPAEKGQIGVSLKMPPWLGVDRAAPLASYQVSPRFGIRPHVGLGLGRDRIFDPATGRFETGERRWILDLGGTGIFTFRPGKAWSPYVGLGMSYSYADPIAPFFRFDDEGRAVMGPQPSAPSTQRNFLTASGLVGMQYRINRLFTLFGEVGVAATPGKRYEWDGRDWRQLSTFDARRPFRSGFGLTVNLK